MLARLDNPTPPYSPKLVEEAWKKREVQWRTLYYNSNVRTLREMYPDRPCLQEVSDETRIIVSEPLVELAGVWKEVLPESSYGLVCEGEDEPRTFRPTR